MNLTTLVGSPGISWRKLGAEPWTSFARTTAGPNVIRTMEVVTARLRARREVSSSTKDSPVGSVRGVFDHTCSRRSMVEAGIMMSLGPPSSTSNGMVSTW